MQSETRYLKDLEKEFKNCIRYYYYQQDIINIITVKAITSINNDVKKAYQDANNQEFILADHFDIFFNNDKYGNYYEKSVDEYMSIIFNDYSVFLYDERTSTKFLPDATYRYRKSIYTLLKQKDEELAKEYLEDLKIYISSHPKQEYETATFCAKTIADERENIKLNKENELGEDENKLKAMLNEDLNWYILYDNALSLHRNPNRSKNS